MNTTTTKGISRSTYRFQIPVFLASLVIGLCIADYFIAFSPLQMSVKTLTRWGTTISVFAAIVATTFLVLRNVSRLYTGIAKKDYQTLYRSGTFMGVYVTFALLAFSNPKLVQSDLYIAIYTPILSACAMVGYYNASYSTTWSAIQKIGHVTNLDTAAIMIMVVVNAIVGMTIMHAIIGPNLALVQNWLTQVVTRSVTTVGEAFAAVGVLVICLRALVGKEPGLIEMERA